GNTRGASIRIADIVDGRARVNLERSGSVGAGATMPVHLASIMTQDRIHLAEVLDFRPDLGVIRLHEQRVVILSAAAMGLLRKELIETLGLDSARRLLLRFGYADGYHDAVNLRARSSWATVLDEIGRAHV